MARVRPILLVHGAWHGAWCWAALQAELDRRGLPSYAVDLPGHGLSTLPLGDLHGDAAHVATVLAGLDDDVVLVGHSYGGAVVTHAADRPMPLRIASLTSSTSPRSRSTTVRACGGSHGRAARSRVALDAAVIGGDDGTSRSTPTRRRRRSTRCAQPAEVSAAVARLDRQPIASFEQPVAGSPRATIASTYVRCTADQAIHIDLQDELASRCDHIVTFDSDHSPFLAMPGAVADILEPLTRR